MALIKCEECGHMISDSARKCPKCGCPVSYSLQQQAAKAASSAPPVAAETTAPSMHSGSAETNVATLIKCEECGHMISARARKCPKCGCPVDHTVVATAQPVQGNTDAPVADGEKTVPSANGESAKSAPIITPGPPMAQPESTKPKEGKSGGGGDGAFRWILIGLLGVLVLVAVGLLCYLFLKPDQSSEREEVALAEQTETGGKTKASEVEETEAEDIIEEESEPDYTIRTDGVGSFLIGTPFSEYDTKSGGEISYGSCNLSSTFVLDLDDSFEEYAYSAYMKLKGDGETMLVLYGGSSETKKLREQDCNVKGIYVYSPLFQTTNGVHVGMPVDELVKNYNATIELWEGEGGLSEWVAAAVVKIPGCERFTCFIDLPPGNYLTITEPDGSYSLKSIETFEQEIRRKNSLGCIVVGDRYNLPTF